MAARACNSSSRSHRHHGGLAGLWTLLSGEAAWSLEGSPEVELSLTPLLGCLLPSPAACGPFAFEDTELLGLSGLRGWCGGMRSSQTDVCNGSRTDVCNDSRRSGKQIWASFKAPNTCSCRKSISGRTYKPGTHTHSHTHFPGRMLEPRQS